MTTVGVTSGLDWMLMIACGTVGGTRGAVFSALAPDLRRQVKRCVRKAPLRNAVFVDSPEK